MRVYRLLAVTCSVFLCSCATENLVFVTSASVGINVDTTSPSASIAHDRVEGYFAPRYQGKAAPTVYASFESNGNIFDRKIKQMIATGNAANIVSGAQAGTSGNAQCVAESADKNMFFGTNTTYGAKIGFSATALNSFILGFKRKEMAIVPKGERSDAYPSLIASIQADDDVKTDAAPNDALGKSSFNQRQFFATGSAADALALTLKDDFAANAAKMLGVYRDNERKQAELALHSLECLASIPDAKLNEVWDNAERLVIFENDSDSTMKTIRTAATPQTARAVYTAKVIQINPTSPYHTGLLNGHLVSICKIAGR